MNKLIVALYIIASVFMGAMILLTLLDVFMDSELSDLLNEIELNEQELYKDLNYGR